METTRSNHLTVDDAVNRLIDRAERFMHQASTALWTVHNTELERLTEARRCVEAAADCLAAALELSKLS